MARVQKSTPYGEMLMENRTARLTILIDPDKKKAFEELCGRIDTTPSQLLRQMIRDFLKDHGVKFGQKLEVSPGDKGKEISNLLGV